MCGGDAALCQITLTTFIVAVVTAAAAATTATTTFVAMQHTVCRSRPNL